jgi:hypothetical protein
VQAVRGRYDIAAITNDDLTIYVIDVAAGDKIPSEGGSGNPLRSPDDQQDRPRAACRRFARGDGA